MWPRTLESALDRQLYGLGACVALAIALALLLVLPVHFITYFLAGRALRVTGSLACRLPGDTMHVLGRCYLALGSALSWQLLSSRD